MKETFSLDTIFKNAHRIISTEMEEEDYLLRIVEKVICENIAEMASCPYDRERVLTGITEIAFYTSCAASKYAQKSGLPFKTKMNLPSFTKAMYREMISMYSNREALWNIIFYCFSCATFYDAVLLERLEERYKYFPGG